MGIFKGGSLWTWTNPGGAPPIPPVVDDGSTGPMARPFPGRIMTMAEIDAYFGRRRLTPAELAILLIILADD